MGFYDNNHPSCPKKEKGGFVDNNPTISWVRYICSRFSLSNFKVWVLTWIWKTTKNVYIKSQFLQSQCVLYIRFHVVKISSVLFCKMIQYVKCYTLWGGVRESSDLLHLDLWHVSRRISSFFLLFQTKCKFTIGSCCFIIVGVDWGPPYMDVIISI